MTNNLLVTSLKDISLEKIVDVFSRVDVSEIIGKDLLATLILDKIEPKKWAELIKEKLIEKAETIDLSNIDIIIKNIPFLLFLFWDYNRSVKSLDDYLQDKNTNKNELDDIDRTCYNHIIHAMTSFWCISPAILFENSLKKTIALYNKIFTHIYSFDPWWAWKTKMYDFKTAIRLLIESYKHNDKLSKLMFKENDINNIETMFDQMI